MPLIPKRVKYRKQQRGRLKGKASRTCTLNFGEYGLKVLESGWVNTRQIEAARVAIVRHLKRGGKMWLRVVADKPVTKKPLETRMGKGKGNVEFWVVPVKPGTILFEVSGVDEISAVGALKLAGDKLPVKTKVISYQGVEELV
ncbi:50S ribosomal protein L16 [Candidatus Calescamantes bacterium]|nr:50S ribosomal protein L16 [Candidatus Calescamantes bacterium]